MSKKIILHLFSKTPTDKPGVSPKSYPIDLSHLLVKLLKEKGYYLIQIGTEGSQLSLVNRSFSDTDNNTNLRLIATITVMEIAG